MLLSFGAFRRTYKRNAPKWKVAAKYTKALWSSFGLTIQPERASFARADTVQSRLRLDLDAIAGLGAEDRERLELLIDNDDFINAFYTDDPAQNVRDIARGVFGEEFVQGPLASLLPNEFFSRTYTRKDTNAAFTHGAPLLVHPERRYTFGPTYDYLMFQELYDYRYRFSKEYGTEPERSPGQFRAFSSPVLAEMDLTFSDKIMDSNINRVYDLNGVTYVLFGEHHHYSACSRRLPNAISAMKWITDMSLACPDVIFDVMMEQGTVTMFPHTAREIVDITPDKCEKYYASRFKTQVELIKRGLTNEQIIAQQPDRALPTHNVGPLSASYLYLFNRFPAMHAWKTREPIFRNVRLHNADVRQGRILETDNARKKVHSILKERGKYPQLASMPGSRETMSGFVFPHELLLPTSIGLVDIDFVSRTFTLLQLPGPADMLFDPVRNEHVTFPELLRRAGSRVVDPVRGKVTFERKVVRKMDALERLSPGLATRFQARFQEAKQEFEVGRLSHHLTAANAVAADGGAGAPGGGAAAAGAAEDPIFGFIEHMQRLEQAQVEQETRALYLEAMFVDFYGMLRALVHSMDGSQARKRVVTFYAGSQHVEAWSYVLQGLGAEQRFVDGSPPNLSLSSEGVRSGASYMSGAQNLAGLNDAMRDIFKRKITAGTVDDFVIRSIYVEVDTFKSTPVRLDTYQSAWDNFNLRVLHHERGLLRRLARIAKEHSSWEVIAAAAQKVMVAIDMFVVDLIANGMDERIIREARFHTMDMGRYNHTQNIEGRPVVESVSFMFKHFSERIRDHTPTLQAEPAAHADVVDLTGADEAGAGAGGVKRKIGSDS